MSTLERFIRESNFIEGIDRPPSKDEISVHKWIVSKKVMKIDDVCKFVNTICGARLRFNEGDDVTVAGHRPLAGGSQVPDSLERLLFFWNNAVNDPNSKNTPFDLHAEYEILHPFLDGNGRSGRALWLWHMEKIYGDNSMKYYFLHMWYYQSLNAAREANNLVTIA